MRVCVVLIMAVIHHVGYDMLLLRSNRHIIITHHPHITHYRLSLHVRYHGWVRMILLLKCVQLCLLLRGQIGVALWLICGKLLWRHCLVDVWKSGHLLLILHGLTRYYWIGLTLLLWGFLVRIHNNLP